jgi:DNA-directed RNA polymerase specialized sigma24 family protein
MMVFVAHDLAAVYSANAGDLVRYATVLVGPHDAADVVNEAVAATIGRGSLADVVDVRAYWFRAVSNTAMSWRRSALRRRRREELAAAMPALGTDPWSPTQARSLLAGLSVQQRAVVYLTYWHDWDEDRVAAALGVSAGTVRKQLGRARARLREVLPND